MRERMRVCKQLQGENQVPLRRALYNLSDPCKKLVKIVESDEFGELAGQHYNPSEDKVPSRRARRLSGPQVAELVTDYQAGVGSVYVLAAKYGLHRNTVASLLKSQGLHIGKSVMGESEIARARQLQSKGLSSNAIGVRIGRDPKTVKKIIG